MEQMPIRVLVVDDEPAIRELLTEYLRGRGHEVVAVVDGESARQRLERDPPDIVVTDLKLPGLDGIEVVRIAKACVPPVPALMMTGFGTVDTAVAAFISGARDYLAKPFRLRDLHASMERVLAAADRDRRGAWAESVVDLLARAELADEPGAAQALVPALLTLLAAAPEVMRVGDAGTGRPDLGKPSRVAVVDAPEPGALPLGPSRWVVVSPPQPGLAPCVRAVHEALSRFSR